MIPGYGYRITVEMARGSTGSWASMGKMDATMSYSTGPGADDSARPKVTLQPHMIKIEAGKAYSAIVETQYPIEQLIATTIHWRRKLLGGIFNRRSILVDRVRIEPLYLLGHEQIANTKVWCSSTKTPVEIQPDLSGFFAYNCQ